MNSVKFKMCVTKLKIKLMLILVFDYQGLWCNGSSMVKQLIQSTTWYSWKTEREFRKEYSNLGKTKIGYCIRTIHSYTQRILYRIFKRKTPQMFHPPSLLIGSGSSRLLSISQGQRCNEGWEVHVSGNDASQNNEDAKGAIEGRLSELL